MNSICFDCGRAGPWERKGSQAIRCPRCRGVYERWRYWMYRNTPPTLGRVCELCGSPRDLTTDHVVPISRGGSNKPKNLRTLCRSCNSRKGAR